MKRLLTLIFLTAASVAAVALSHYYQTPLYEWTRLLVIFPAAYAGIHYRRTGSVSTALLILLLETPILVMRYHIAPRHGVNFLVAIIAAGAAGIFIGHVLRREKENSDTIRQIGELSEKLETGADAVGLYTALESLFRERGKSDSVTTYLFDADGRLRPRGELDAPPLPDKHLLYTVVESGEFFVSNYTEEDPRLTVLADAADGHIPSQIAAFPILYGGEKRGVIALADSADDRFGRETMSLLANTKQAVENLLELVEIRQTTIQHEMRRLQIRDTFSSYVSRAVAEEILKDPDRIDLGGNTCDVTVMFAEVINFKELAGELAPETLISMLNEYFTAAIDAAFGQNGTIDKFIGNSIMTFWGAPLPHPDAANAAVRCALDIQQRVSELNKNWESAGKPAFHVGIGINSGNVVAGNIGSIRRMEYTIIGDTVNLAARLKSLTHDNAAPILASQSTFDRLRGGFAFDRKFETHVKGKSEAVTAYQLKTV